MPLEASRDDLHRQLNPSARVRTRDSLAVGQERRGSERDVEEEEEEEAIQVAM